MTVANLVDGRYGTYMESLPLAFANAHAQVLELRNKLLGSSGIFGGDNTPARLHAALAKAIEAAQDEYRKMMAV